ncbi:DUF6525 family protein [Pararoseomonas sp. SCSIO 73927]|uniref:DUF6525 family protein n=1 Tax=Pararoseomonas sp. SCSIO 73927 TaxID=3114537 RepID=UPI0030D0783B
MDNSMAAKPYSKLKGDPYQAYEELPAEVRRALQEALVDWCPLRAREWHLQLVRQQRLRPAQAAFVLVQTIRGQDHAEVAAFARTWPKGAQAYPHLAADATLQRYAGTEGIPAAEPFLIAPPAKPAKARSKPPEARSKPPKTRAKPPKVGAKRPKVGAKRPKVGAKRPKARAKGPVGRRIRH